MKVVSDKSKIRYPWDEWFRKGKFKITRGTHFHCQTHSMVAQIRNVAAARGVSVSIATTEDVVSVSVR